MNVLRGYQDGAVESVVAAWKQSQATLGVAATGAGKTQIFCEIIRRHPGKCIILAHRTELVQQAVDRLKSFGIEASVEQGEREAQPSLWNASPVIVATPQTLYSNKFARLKKFRPEDFNTIVCDECFPAGTTVDGRRIETIQKGDAVRSFDHGSGRIVFRRVVRLFKSRPKMMVRVWFSNGKQIICTAGHPFFTRRGYVPAIMLAQSDICTIIAAHEEACHDALLYLPQAGALHWAKEAAICHSEAGVLFGRLPSRPSRQSFQQDNGGYASEIGKEVFRKDHGSHESQICFCADEAKQPDASFEGPQENVKISSRQNLSRAWLKRNTNQAANRAGFRVASSDGSSHWNTSSQGPVPIASNLLQGGHRPRANQVGNRGGWQEPQKATMEISGSSQNGNFELLGVDRVEILERGSNGQFESVCSDGFVYNIEVEGSHNYFAEGILVHNCHHYSGAPAFEAVINHFKQNPNAKILGVTATPDRADSQAMARVFDTVAFNIEITDLIKLGYLVNVDQRMAKIESLDFSKCRTTAGELNSGDLIQIMEAERNLLGMADAIIKTIGQKRTVVFCAGIKQAERLSEIFNRHREGSANCVFGHTPEDERKETLRKFSTGELQICVNVGVLTEGYDNPGIEAVVMARATLSRSLYAQMAGRGLRALDGVVEGVAVDDAAVRRAAISDSAKPSLLLLDFVGNSGRHSLITSADILGGKISEQARVIARKKIEKNGRGDMLDELALAEQELKEREESRKRRGLKPDATFTLTYVDPFDAFAKRAEKWKGYVQTKPLSPAQRGILAKNGHNPDDYTPAEGQALITKIFQIKPWQIQKLVSAGYPAAEVSTINTWDAYKLIDAVKKNGGRRPTKEFTPPPPKPERALQHQQSFPSPASSDEPDLSHYDENPPNLGGWQ